MKTLCVLRGINLYTRENFVFVILLYSLVINKASVVKRYSYIGGTLKLFCVLLIV